VRAQEVTWSHHDFVALGIETHDIQRLGGVKTRSPMRGFKNGSRPSAPTRKPQGVRCGAGCKTPTPPRDRPAGLASSFRLWPRGKVKCGGQTLGGQLRVARQDFRVSGAARSKFQQELDTEPRPFTQGFPPRTSTFVTIHPSLTASPHPTASMMPQSNGVRGGRPASRRSPSTTT